MTRRYAGRNCARTSERKAVLMARYATAECLHALLKEMNALPGTQINCVSSMRKWAEECGVRRAARGKPVVLSGTTPRLPRVQTSQNIPRGRPGVALPPVSFAWPILQEIALRHFRRELRTYDDLPAWNRQLIAGGWVPVCVRSEAAA